MNNRTIMVFFMCAFFGLTVSCGAQQVDKEIAKNQVEQVKLELEIANNEVLRADSDNEEEYLESQAQAQKDAEMATELIDSEAEALFEQAKQDADQNIKAMEKEEQAYMKQAAQETEQKAAVIEEENNRTKLDMSETANK